MHRPPPFKNEPWYGYVGRLSLRTLLPESVIKQQLYGSKDFNISIHFLTKPNLLVRSQNFTRNEVEKFIRDNSLVDYFKAFLSTERQNNIEQQQWDPANKNWSISNYLGFNRRVKLPIVPKYCPLCTKEQLKEFGELFFSRLHQIPNIQVCSVHQCYLKDCILETFSPVKYNFFRPTIRCCPATTIDVCNSSVILELSNVQASIAESNYQIDFDYKKRVKQLGYTRGSRIDQVRLANDYEKFYGQNLLCSYAYSTLLFEPGEIFDPYRHLLFDYFLNEKQQTGVLTDKIYVLGSTRIDKLNPAKSKMDKPQFEKSIFDIMEDIKRSVEKLKTSTILMRITRTSILREAKLPVRVKHLPELETFVKTLIESLEDFRARRLYYAAKYLKENGMFISPSSILFRASVRKPSNRLIKEAELIHAKIASN